jgi:inner membrane protein
VQASLNWTIIVFAIFGAVVPDIDHARSYVGRLFWFVSQPLERKFGHRSVTHSLLGWLLATLILALPLFIIVQTQSVASLLAIRWLAAFSLAYLSHLILDMFNPRGSQLFWPNPSRDIILKNAKLRPKSGSRTELFLFLIFCIFMLLSFPVSKYGVLTSLRWLLATPESVINEMQTLKTKMYLEFEGIYKTTNSNVIGTCELLNYEGKKLIVLFQRKIFSLSDKPFTDIIASNLRFKKTELPLTLSSYVAKDQTFADLLNQLPDTGLLSGMIYLPEGLKLKTASLTFSLSLFDYPSLSTYETVSQIGTTLLLSYATKKELEKLQWAETFELNVQKDRAQLARFKFDLGQLEKQISEEINQTKLQLLTLQVQETQLKIMETELSLKSKDLKFSVQVVARF